MSVSAWLPRLRRSFLFVWAAGTVGVACGQAERAAPSLPDAPTPTDTTPTPETPAAPTLAVALVAQDQKGAAVADGVSSLHFVITATPAAADETVTVVAADPCDVLSADTLALDVNGAVGTGEVSLRSTRTGRRTLTVTSATRPAQTATASYAFVAGPTDAGRSALTLGRPSFTEDGLQLLAVVATLRDVFENPIVDAQVTLTSPTPGATLVPSSGRTDAAGQFTAQLQAPAQAEVLADLTLAPAPASSGNVTTPPVPLRARTTYAFGPPAQSASSVRVSPALVVADGAAVPTYTAVVKDANNAPLANANVVWSATGPAGQQAGGTSTTGADGRANFAGQPSAATGTREILAGVGNLALASNVVFVAGPAIAANSNFACGACQVVADGQAALPIGFCAHDANFHPCAGQAFTLRSLGQNVTFLPGAQVRADAAGCVQASVRSNVVQSTTIAVQQGNAVVAQGSVQFVLGAPVAAQSSLAVATGQSAVANGNGIALAGVVRDVLGRPVPNQQVLLHASDPLASVVPRKVTTDGNGTYATQLRSRRAGTHTVSARMGGDAPLSGQVVLSAPAATCSGPLKLPLVPTALVAPPAGDAGRLALAVNFNGDAFADLVATTVTQNQGNLFVLPGSPNGLAPTPSWVVDVPGTPVGLAAADFDQDGQQDLAIVNDANQLVVISPNQPAQTVDLAKNVRGLCLGDIDGDGTTDIVAVSTDGVTVLRNLGDGNFTAPTFTGGGQVLSSCTVADINDDGMGEVIVTEAQNSILYAFTHAGNGALAHLADSPQNNCPNLTNLVAGDFDGDGRMDVAATCTSFLYVPTDNRVLMWRNQGDGTLQQRPDVAAGYPLASLRVADVDGDGHTDLLAASSAGYALVFAGDGTGQLAGPQAIGIGDTLTQVTAGDFYGRSRLDLAYAASRPAVGIVPSFAPGQFLSLQVAPKVGDTLDNLETQRLIACDLNGDGRTDFVKANWNMTPRVFLQQADGTFPTASAPSDQGQVARAVTVGDFAGNGRQMILAGGFYDNKLCLYPNAGDGAPAPCSEAAAFGARWWELAAGDVDGDGLDDVVGLVDQDQLLVVYLNQGDGTFAPGPAIDGHPIAFGPSWVNSLQLVDVDNDGLVDLVVGNPDHVFVYHNEGAGSFVLRQTLNAPQIFDYPTPNVVAAADLDGDGAVDLVTGSNGTQPSIFRNAGDGTFVPQNDPMAEADPAYRVFPPLLLDVNGDGRPDLVAGIRTPTGGGLHVRLGGANFAFGPPAFYATAMAAQIVGAQLAQDPGPTFALGNVLQQITTFLQSTGCAP